MPKDLGHEIRMVDADISSLETRRESGETERRAAGFGVVYNSEVEIFPGFKEKILAGAFSAHVKDAKEIKSYFNHDPAQVLSTTKSNPPLVIEDRDDGLYYESPIPPTSYGKDLEINLSRKNVRGSSIAFRVLPGGDKRSFDKDGVLHREIHKAMLFEIGPVTDPANVRAPASLRDAKGAFDEISSEMNEERRTTEAREVAEREKNANIIRLQKQREREHEINVL